MLAKFVQHYRSSAEMCNCIAVPRFGGAVVQLNGLDCSFAGVWGCNVVPLKGGTVMQFR